MFDENKLICLETGFLKRQKLLNSIVRFYRLVFYEQFKFRIEKNIILILLEEGDGFQKASVFKMQDLLCELR